MPYNEAWNSLSRMYDAVYGPYKGDDSDQNPDDESDGLDEEEEECDSEEEDNGDEPDTP